MEWRSISPPPPPSCYITVSFYTFRSHFHLLRCKKCNMYCFLTRWRSLSTNLPCQTWEFLLIDGIPSVGYGWQLYVGALLRPTPIIFPFSNIRVFILANQSSKTGGISSLGDVHYFLSKCRKLSLVCVSSNKIQVCANCLRKVFPKELSRPASA